jgi:hypothetical protein
MIKRLFFLSIAICLLCLPAGLAAASPAASGRSGQSGQEIAAYWTSERTQKATPREILLDDQGRRVPAAKPGSGGGGGGSSTGSLWTGASGVRTSTGKVFFTLGGTDYVCSGAAVNDGSAAAIVLTAGHCAYDEVANQFATNWTFVSNYDAGGFAGCASDARCYTGLHIVISQIWHDSTASDTNWEADFAFVRVDLNKDNQSMDSLISGYGVGTGQPATSYSFGYPAAKKYNGTKLVYCSGNVFTDPYQATDMGMACNMTGGSSGGPWIRDFNATANTGTLVSVNSYKYLTQPNNLYGPIFTSHTLDVLQAARTATDNSLVPAP